MRSTANAATKTHMQVAHYIIESTSAPIQCTAKIFIGLKPRKFNPAKLSPFTVIIVQILYELAKLSFCLHGKMHILFSKTHGDRT